MTRTAEDVFAFFHENDGLREEPDGSNHNWITDWCGLGDVPWCAETVSIALMKAGFGSFEEGRLDMDGVWKRYAWGWAYVPDIRQAFEDAGRFFSDPQPGDLVIFDWDGDGWGDHVGVFERDLGDGTCLVREGNTSNNRLEQRRRPYSLIAGFCRPPYSGEPGSNNNGGDEVDTELANTIRYSAQVLTEIKEQLISPLGEGDFFRGAERFVSLVDKIDDLERKVDALAAAQA